MAVMHQPVPSRATGRWRLDRLVWLVGSVLALGCVTSGQGEMMQKDITMIRQRLETLERRGTEAEEQMTRLRTILDEATALLARNNADVGARVQKAEMDLGALLGKLEEARHLIELVQKQQTDDTARLAALEQGQQKIVDRVAPAMTEDRETLWKQAQERMANGMREDSRRFFRGFIQRFPQDPRAAQAHIEVGRSYALEGKHTQAAAEYQRVLDAFPKSPEVPEAMWLIAQSFVDLKFCTDARALLQDLLRRFPRSPRANDARARLRDLQKLVKDKRACAS
jgi:TolA-binding protein